jgi:hypothetical protein
VKLLACLDARDARAARVQVAELMDECWPLASSWRDYVKAQVSESVSRQEMDPRLGWFVRKEHARQGTALRLGFMHNVWEACGVIMALVCTTFLVEALLSSHD